MKQFWNEEELTAHKMNQYHLANMLDQIIRKYVDSVGEYAAIRNMVDCQFATTIKFFSF